MLKNATAETIKSSPLKVILFLFAKVQVRNYILLEV